MALKLFALIALLILLITKGELIHKLNFISIYFLIKIDYTSILNICNACNCIMLDFLLYIDISRAIEMP